MSFLITSLVIFGMSQGQSVHCYDFSLHVFWLEYMPYILIKKGNVTITMPEITRIYVFEIKYGNTINPSRKKVE